MPISPIVLQRRHAELGRIRLGSKGDRGQPQKLTQFRFTSPHQRHITDLAHLYGGTPRPWDNQGRPEHEVYTTAQAIPVIVVKGGVSQWLETWTGGGCVHRCDGYTNTLTAEPCDPNDPAHVNAKPTTRLSVMLRDLDAIGVWRLESHGWNSAAELPGIVEMAAMVADLVPATLVLSERVTIRDGRTSRFVVPGLDLQVAPSRLAAIVSGGHDTGNGNGSAPAEVDGGERVAIEAPRPDYAALAAVTDTLGGVRDLWTRAQEGGHLTDAVKKALTERADDLRDLDTMTEEPPPEPEPGPEPVPVRAPSDGATAVTAATSDDVKGIWMQVLAAAGQAGLTLTQTREAFARHTEGVIVDDATPDQMRAFHDALTRGEVTTDAR